MSSLGKNVYSNVSGCVLSILSSKTPERHENIIRNSHMLEAFLYKTVPAMIVNGKVHRGDLDERTMLENICQSIIEQPKICLKIEKENDIEKIIKEQSTTVSIKWLSKTVIISFIAGLFIFLGFLCSYRAKLKTEFKARLNRSVDDF